MVYDDYEFGESGWKLPEEQIYELHAAETRANKQRLVNEIFTTERQEQMLMDADLDSEGRKVRYYRYMGEEDLYEMMRVGYQDMLHMGHDPDVEVDPMVWEKFVNRVVGDIRSIEGYSLGNLVDELKSCFENITDSEIEEVQHDFSYRNLLALSDRFLSEEELIKLHYIGDLAHFLSPYFSLSVGGIVRYPIEFGDTVYVEAILPSSKVTPSPVRQRAEKEVLVRDLGLNQISRVFFTNTQIEEEVMMNPEIGMGSYYDEKLGFQRSKGNWQLEPIKKFLPVNLVD